MRKLGLPLGLALALAASARAAERADRTVTAPPSTPPAPVWGGAPSLGVAPDFAADRGLFPTAPPKGAFLGESPYAFAARSRPELAAAPAPGVLPPAAARSHSAAWLPWAAEPSYGRRHAAPSAQAEEEAALAGRVWEALSKIRQPAPGAEFEAKMRRAAVETFRSFIAARRPIPFVFPGFPAKSPNHETKTLGPFPDLGEELALARLNGFIKEVEAAYPPGAEVTVLSDGRIFADAVGVFPFRPPLPAGPIDPRPIDPFQPAP